VYGTQRRGVRTVCRSCTEAFVRKLKKEEALLANADEEATLL
jgi:hypothetical protein